ncbi:DUF927 domain-containing protein [Wielerella bovis]|nr:DUF927 domain-containing protein [Wielerella bovis]
MQNLGLTVYSGRQKREWLADYLQEQGSRENWLITDKAGWINGAYVLPSGEILHTSKNKRIFYNGDKSQADAYVISGSLKQWQDNIAKYATGNSRLCLALGISFAAPLLSLLRVESGGFHLCGDSSIGKTTAVIGVELNKRYTQENSYGLFTRLSPNDFRKIKFGLQLP